MKFLTLPNTPMCRVIYIRGGVTYGQVIKTPATLDDVRIAMLSYKPPVAAKEVVRIEPIKPLPPLHRPHPALRRIAKFDDHYEEH